MITVRAPLPTSGMRPPCRSHAGPRPRVVEEARDEGQPQRAAERDRGHRHEHDQAAEHQPGALRGRRDEGRQPPERGQPQRESEEPDVDGFDEEELADLLDDAGDAGVRPRAQVTVLAGDGRRFVHEVEPRVEGQCGEHRRRHRLQHQPVGRSVALQPAAGDEIGEHPEREQDPLLPDEHRRGSCCGAEQHPPRLRLDARQPAA